MNSTRFLRLRFEFRKFVVFVTGKSASLEFFHFLRLHFAKLTDFKIDFRTSFALLCFFASLICAAKKRAAKSARNSKHEFEIKAHFANRICARSSQNWLARKSLPKFALSSLFAAWSKRAFVCGLICFVLISIWVLFREFAFRFQLWFASRRLLSAQVKALCGGALAKAALWRA